MLTLVTRGIGLQEWVERECHEQNSGHHHGWNQHVERDRVTTDHELRLPWHETQRTLQEEHVPVRLCASRYGRGVVRAVVPHTVDRERRSHDRQHAEHDEEEPTGLGDVDREERVTDHILVRATRAGVLRVFVHHNQDQVDGYEREDQSRHQENVGREQPRNDLGAGELATKEHVGDVASDHRDCLDDAVRDAQTVTGKHVIGERVAGEACCQTKDHQREADHPVQFTRLAERAGEEHPHHVSHDRGHEQQRRPVVDLTHQQAAANME